MRKAAVVMFVMLGSVAMAAAQAPGATPLQTPGALPPPPAPDRHDGEVSPTIAVLLSVGGTAASYAAIAVGHENHAVVTAGLFGTFLLPSAGRWYAGSPGLGGMAIRGLGVGLATVGLVEAFSSCPILVTDGECNRSGSGTALVVLGGLAYFGGTLYDIVSASSDAREHNARLHNVAIVPVIRDHGAGVAFAAQF